MNTEGTWIRNDRIRPQHTCQKPAVDTGHEGAVWRCPCGVAYLIEGGAWVSINPLEVAMVGIAQAIRQARTPTAPLRKEIKR